MPVSIFSIDPKTGQTVEITAEQMRSYFCEAREPIYIMSLNGLNMKLLRNK